MEWAIHLLAAGVCDSRLPLPQLPQDVVERFHLLLILAFVVVEEMGNRCAAEHGVARAGASCSPVALCKVSPCLPALAHLPAPCSGAHAPNPVVLWGCLRIYAGEVVIDVIKHAVLGKFNEIR